MKVIQAVLFTDNDFIKFFSSRRKGNLANLLVLHVSDAWAIKIFFLSFENAMFFFFLSVVNVFLDIAKRISCNLATDVITTTALCR